MTATPSHRSTAAPPPSRRPPAARQWAMTSRSPPATAAPPLPPSIESPCCVTPTAFQRRAQRRWRSCSNGLPPPRRRAVRVVVGGRERGNVGSALFFVAAPDAARVHDILPSCEPLLGHPFDVRNTFTNRAHTLAKSKAGGVHCVQVVSISAQMGVDSFAEGDEEVRRLISP